MDLWNVLHCASVDIWMKGWTPSPRTYVLRGKRIFVIVYLWNKSCISAQFIWIYFFFFFSFFFKSVEQCFIFSVFFQVQIILKLEISPKIKLECLSSILKLYIYSDSLILLWIFIFWPFMRQCSRSATERKHLDFGESLLNQMLSIMHYPSKHLNR